MLDKYKVKILTLISILIVNIIFMLLINNIKTYGHEKSFFEIDTQVINYEYYNSQDSLILYKDKYNLSAKIYKDPKGVIYWFLNSGKGLSLLENDIPDIKNIYPETKSNFLPYFKVESNDSEFYYKSISNLKILFKGSLTHSFILPQFFCDYRYIGDSLRISYSGDSTLYIDSLKIPCYKFNNIKLVISEIPTFLSSCYTTVLIEKESKLPVVISQCYMSRYAFMIVDSSDKYISFSYNSSFTKPKQLKILLINDFPWNEQSNIWKSAQNIQLNFNTNTKGYEVIWK